MTNFPIFYVFGLNFFIFFHWSKEGNVYVSIIRILLASHHTLYTTVLGYRKRRKFVLKSSHGFGRNVANWTFNFFCKPSSANFFRDQNVILSTESTRECNQGNLKKCMNRSFNTELFTKFFWPNILISNFFKPNF